MKEWIENIIGSLNQLEGISAVSLVFLSCIAVGYVVRSIKRIDNSSIPAIVTLWGVVFMGLVANSRATDMSLRVWLVRNVLVGAVVGVASVLMHKLVLKRVEDWISAKFNLGNTEFFKKSDSEPPKEP